MSQAVPPTNPKTDAAVGLQDGQGEEGDAEDINTESDAESVDDQVLDMTVEPGQGSGFRSMAVSAPTEGGGVESTVSPATTKDEGEPNDVNRETYKNGDDQSDGGRKSPTVSSSSANSPHDRLSGLVGWSELLMVDVVLAYFRYYARRRKGYVGRTFSHRSQVPRFVSVISCLEDEFTAKVPMPSA